MFARASPANGDGASREAMAAGLRQQLPQSMTHVEEWSSVLCWPLSPAHHEGDHQRGPPWLKQQGKSISSWQGLETFKAMVHNGQFSTYRFPRAPWISSAWRARQARIHPVTFFLACLHGKVIKLGSFPEVLKVCATKFKINFPTLQGTLSSMTQRRRMKCCPEARHESPEGAALQIVRPSEEVVLKVLEKCGEIGNMDIPMLDPQHSEMTGRKFHTFSLGGGT